MKYEINFSYNGGGVAYLLQSVAIHFIHTVGGLTPEFYIRKSILILFISEQVPNGWKISVKCLFFLSLLCHNSVIGPGP